MSGSIRSAGVLQLHGWFLENVQRFSKEVDHEKDPCQLLHQVYLAFVGVEYRILQVVCFVQSRRFPWFILLRAIHPAEEARATSRAAV